MIQSELDNVELGKGKNAVKAQKVKQDVLLKKLLFGSQKEFAKAFRDPAERFKKKP